MSKAQMLKLYCCKGFSFRSGESDNRLSGNRKMISLPQGMIVMLFEMVAIDRPIQLAAGQRTADDRLKYLTAHYSADGQFTLLISATLQQQIE